MRPAPWESELLGALAEMPFLDRLELAAVTGWFRGAVYRGVGKLESDGYAASISHATGLLASTRRYHLTGDGLRRLAEVNGAALDDLLRSRPVSRQWQRILVDRLDALAVIYRLAATVANAAHPVRFRWYRAAPLDAAMTLPGGRTLGVLRQGAAADRTGFAKRVRRLADGPLPGVVLVLVPDEVRLRHARRLLARTPVAALLAPERDAALAGPVHRIWRPPSVKASLHLRYALERLQPGGQLIEEDPLSRADIPGGGETVRHSLSSMLKPAEKRALDIISDWPWLTRRDLAALLNVSGPRASQATVSLESNGLATRPRGAAGRVALTDEGLALLARRDRTSVGAAKKRWSVSPLNANAAPGWRNVSGRRSRQLLRNLEHTGAVHQFISALAYQTRALGWEVCQLDPPHRASRHFRHRGGPRSVQPDAFGLLRRGPATWAFFLEWERRAVRPTTMTDRLAPYLRYYSTGRPTDDHGVAPDVLVVFDDSLAADHFLRLAEEEMARERVRVPLWVFHRAALETLGPLGRAWRTPGDWEPGRLPPAQ